MSADDVACGCWASNNALGHDGHCCFLDAERKWREDEDVCHQPGVKCE